MSKIFQTIVLCGCMCMLMIQNGFAVVPSRLIPPFCKDNYDEGMVNDPNFLVVCGYCVDHYHNDEARKKCMTERWSFN